MAKTLVDLEVQSKAIGDGKLLIGAATTGLATAQTISGDITISNAGASAIVSGVIVESDLTSGFETTLIRTDGSAIYAANQPMNNFIFTGLGNGVSPGDSVNKAQLDAAISGLSWKDAVDTSTTAVLSGSMIADNGTPATGERAYNTTAHTITWFATQGPTAIDGLALTNGMRILVKDESVASGPAGGEGRMYNGIYTRTSVDVWTRSADMDASAEFEGAAVFVQQGTSNSNKGYTQTADGVTMDSSNIIWSLFTTAGGNADTLDGLDSLQFLRSDATDSLTAGTLSVASGAAISISSGGTFTLASGSTWNIGATAVTATAAHLNGLGTIVVRETPSGTPNGVLLTFGLAQTPKAGSEEVYVNGILQDSGSGNDYQMSGADVVFEAGVAPLTGAKIRVSYRY